MCTACRQRTGAMCCMLSGCSARNRRSKQSRSCSSDGFRCSSCIAVVEGERVVVVRAATRLRLPLYCWPGMLGGKHRDLADPPAGTRPLVMKSRLPRVSIDPFACGQYLAKARRRYPRCGILLNSILLHSTPATQAPEGVAVAMASRHMSWKRGADIGVTK